MTRDPRIDAYIANAEPFAQPLLTHVRERVHAMVPDVKEDIKWRMPAFLKGGALILIVGAFKSHIAVNFWRGKDLAPHDTSGAFGQLGRVSALDELPANFDAMIADAASLADQPAKPRTRKAAPATPSPLHPRFEAALEAAPEAQRHFDAFPPGQRREYADWIAEAKQEQTRDRRIAQAIEWIGEGKRRNWQYERR